MARAQRNAVGSGASPPVPPLHLLGLALLFVHLLLSPLVFSAATVEVFEYNKVAILQATAILLFAGAAGRRIGLWIDEVEEDEPILARVGRTLREPIALGMALFLASAALSTVFSINRRTSLLGCHESFAGIITIASYAVLFFATRALCRDLRHWRVLLFATVAAAAASSLYGVIQLTGLDLIKWGRTSGWEAYTRVFSTMGHPNFLAAFMLMAYPVVVYFAIRAFRQGLRVVGAGLVLTGVLVTGMVVISLSRGAWGGFVAMGVVLVLGLWFVAGDRRAALWIVGGYAAAVVLVLAGLLTFPSGRIVLDSLWSRFFQLFEVEALTHGSRRYIWSSSLEMLRDYPVFGVGLDAFQLAFEKYRSVAYWNVEWNGTPTKAHNEALHILATQGLAGAAATLVMTAGIGIAFARALRRRVRDRHLLVAAVAGVVGFYVQNVFSFTIAGIGTLFLTFAALLSRLGETSEPEEGSEPDGPPGRGARHAGDSLPSLATQAGMLAVGAIAIYYVVVVPYQANSLCRLGASLLQVNNPALAVDYLNRCVETDPTKELYWVRLGTANQAAARTAPNAVARRALLQKARQAHEESIRLVPVNAYNHANLGRLLGEMARETPPMATPAEAIAKFEDALAIDPNNAYFYSDAANTALGFGDRDRARRYAAACVEKYPHFGPPFAQLGLLELVEAQRLAQMGKLDEAARPYEETARLLGEAVRKTWYADEEGRGVAASNLAAALIRLQRYREAVEAAELAVRSAPDYVDGRVNLGTAYEAIGKPAKAHDAHVAVLKRKPDHPIARNALKGLRKFMQERGLPLPALDPAVQKALEQD